MIRPVAPVPTARWRLDIGVRRSGHVGCNARRRRALPLGPGSDRPGDARGCPGGFAAQAHRILDDIDAVLTAAGSACDLVLRVECYLADAADFDEWNGIWCAHFRPPRPARTTVVTGFVIPEMLIELQVTAIPVPATRREQARGRGRRGSGRALLRVLPAATRPRGRGRREQPRRAAAPPMRTAAGSAPPRQGRCRSLGSRSTACAPSSIGGRPSTSIVASSRRLAPWLLRFRTYCNEADHARGTAAIARLGHDVFDLVEEMRADGVEFELHKQGMVFAGESQDDVRSELAKLDPDAGHGYDLPDDVVVETRPESSSRPSPRWSAPASSIRQHWHVGRTRHRRSGEVLRPMGRRSPRAPRCSSSSAGQPADARANGRPAISKPAGRPRRRSVDNSAGPSIGISPADGAGKGYSFWVGARR